MPTNFSDLAHRARDVWPDDAKTVYEAAGKLFDAELAARKDLGRMLGQARAERHLSQPELSRAAGVQQAEISKIERGLGNPTTATIGRLLSALDLELVVRRKSEAPTTEHGPA